MTDIWQRELHEMHHALCRALRIPESGPRTQDWEGLIEMVKALKRRVSPVSVLYELPTEHDGVIRVERWPEGFVVWCAGRIQWKSWEERGL